MLHIIISLYNYNNLKAIIIIDIDIIIQAKHKLFLPRFTLLFSPVTCSLLIQSAVENWCLKKQYSVSILTASRPVTNWKTSFKKNIFVRVLFEFNFLTSSKSCANISHKLNIGKFFVS